jgi:hypothetical protein
MLQVPDDLSLKLLFHDMGLVNEAMRWDVKSVTTNFPREWKNKPKLNTSVGGRNVSILDRGILLFQPSNSQAAVDY